MHNLQDEKKLFYERIRCKSLCHKYNSVSPEMLGIRQDLIKNILGRTKALFLIEQPFMCDYGYNIQIGENFYSNHNLLILDEAPVIFGCAGGGLQGVLRERSTQQSAESRVSDSYLHW